MKVVAVLFLFSALFCNSNFSHAQKKDTAPKQVTIQDNHGKITIEETVYNDSYKDLVLNVDKYIDTLKKIWIIVGSNPDGMTTLPELQSGKGINPLGGGAFPSAFIIRGGEKILTLKLKNGKLIINSDIQGIDGKYIAKIRENKLIPSPEAFNVYASDKYFELFDSYNIPVLQIELNSKSNEIYIGGAFNDSLGYTIISKSCGFQSRHFLAPILLMPQSQRDSVVYNYKQFALSCIKPIHEE